MGTYLINQILDGKKVSYKDAERILSITLDYLGHILLKQLKKMDNCCILCM
jgi:hypothetical protein